MARDANITALRREVEELRRQVVRGIARLAAPGGGGGGGPIIAAFRITDAERDGANNRWTYTGRRVVKATAGYGGWADHDDDADYTLLNVNEDQNGSGGTYGNGIAQHNLDAVNAVSGSGTFALQPIPAGTRVYAKRERVEATGAAEWWIINLPNGVDGLCEEEA